MTTADSFDVHYNWAVFPSYFELCTILTKLTLNLKGNTEHDASG